MQSSLTAFQSRVLENLRTDADTFAERAAVYKDNYAAVGRVMEALFPNGHEQITVEDHNRWHLFELVIVKLTRYVNNYDTGGHSDSLKDMRVYLAMLEALDAPETSVRGEHDKVPWWADTNSENYWFRDWDGPDFLPGDKVQYRHHQGKGPIFTMIGSGEEGMIQIEDLEGNSALTKKIWMRPYPGIELV